MHGGVPLFFVEAPRVTGNPERRTHLQIAYPYRCSFFLKPRDFPTCSQDPRLIQEALAAAAGELFGRPELEECTVRGVFGPPRHLRILWLSGGLSLTQSQTPTLPWELVPLRGN